MSNELYSESEASEEAKRQGLVYAQFGRWKDPKTGHVVAKTENGRLVPWQGLQSDNGKEQVRQVAKFAIQAHGDQMYGNEPYSYHLEKVYNNVVKYGGSELHQQVAWLHDVVEDTPFTVEDIAERFGGTVAKLVDLVTNQETKEETFKRIRTDSDAVFVKLADRLANIEEGGKIKMYRKRHPLFKSMLYQPGEFDDLWAAIDQQLEM